MLFWGTVLTRLYLDSDTVLNSQHTRTNVVSLVDRWLKIVKVGEDESSYRNQLKLHSWINFSHDGVRRFPVCVYWFGGQSWWSPACLAAVSSNGSSQNLETSDEQRQQVNAIAKRIKINSNNSHSHEFSLRSKVIHTFVDRNWQNQRENENQIQFRHFFFYF